MLRAILPPLLVLAASPVPARDVAAPAPKCASCGNETYGTSIVWSGTPAEAAKKAKQEEKLVFVLHVSGRFEDPRFT